MNEKEIAEYLNTEYLEYKKYCDIRPCSEETCFISKLCKEYDLNENIHCFAVYLALASLRDV